MKEQFNLSEFIEYKLKDDIHGEDNGYYVVPIEKVKEFIRRLKEEMNNLNLTDNETYVAECEVIDKLAGDKLSTDKNTFTKGEKK